MSNCNLDDTNFTPGASTTVLIASGFFSPLRDLAVHWAVLDFAFPVLERWSHTEFATVLLLHSLVTITLLHAWATFFITV
jgi:hypothetical protein